MLLTGPKWEYFLEKNDIKSQLLDDQNNFKK